MYDKLLAAVTVFYKKYNAETAVFNAKAYISICQVFLVIIILSILKKYGIIFLDGLGNNIIYSIIVIGWLIAVSIYFSEKRINIALKSFLLKSIRYRRILSLIALLHFILPMILLPILLSKKA